MKNAIGSAACLIALLAFSCGVPKSDLWVHSYNTSIDTWCYDIQPTNQGKLLILGNTTPSNGFSQEFLLMSLQPTDGNKEWVRRYFNPQLPYRQALFIEKFQKKKDRYIIGGYTLRGNKQAVILMEVELNDKEKIEEKIEGKVLWTKVYWLEDSHLMPSDMVITDQDQLIVTGYREQLSSGKAKDFWIMRLDDEGNVIDRFLYDIKIFGNDTEFNEIPVGLALTANGNYLVAGNAQSSSMGTFPMALELKPDFKKNRAVLLQGKIQDNFQVTSLLLQRNTSGQLTNNIFLAGFSKQDAVDPSYNSFVIKLNISHAAPGFTIPWTKAYYPKVNKGGPEYAYATLQPRVGTSYQDELIVAGSGRLSNPSDALEAFIFKVDAGGIPVWSNSFGETNRDDGFFALEYGNKEAILVGGYNKSYPSGSIRNLWILEVDKSGNLSSDDNKNCLHADHPLSTFEFGLALKEVDLKDLDFALQQEDSSSDEEGFELNERKCVP